MSCFAWLNTREIEDHRLYQLEQVLLYLQILEGLSLTQSNHQEIVVQGTETDHYWLSSTQYLYYTVAKTSNEETLHQLLPTPCR